jgi:hypothetical protein
MEAFFVYLRSIHYKLHLAYSADLQASALSGIFNSAPCYNIL